MLPGVEKYDYGRVLKYVKGPKFTLEVDRIISHGGFSSCSHVLDFACGTGDTMRYIGNKVGAQMTGFEVAHTSKQFHDGLDVRYGYDGNNKLPFADNAFSHVYMSHVLLLLPNAHEVLAELKRILQNEGKIIILDPNARFIYAHFFHNLVSGYRPDPYMVRMYSRSSVMRLLSSDFKDLKGEYIGAFPQHLNGLLSFFPEKLRAFLRERVIVSGIKK